MNVNRDFVALVFSLLLAASFWFYTMSYLNPLLRANLDTVDDTIALYVDTLHVVEEGRVEMQLPAEISSVGIDYEIKGKKQGYEVPSDGWYVVVSYQFGGKITKTASAIRTYSEEASLKKTVFSPDKICLVKKASSDLVGVEKC